MLTDTKNPYDEVLTLSPASRTSNDQGVGVDLANAGGATINIQVGTWTDGSHTFEVQESDDNSTFSAVAAADLIGSEPVVDGATDDEQVYSIGYVGSKRYIRVAVTVTDATSGAVYGATVRRGPMRKQPA